MKEYKNIDLKTKKIPLEGLGQWIITISGDEWAKILKNSENSLVANLQVPGFRKGKAPTQIAKKHIKDAEIFRNAGSRAIKVAYQYCLDQKDLDVKVKDKFKITDLSEKSCQLVLNFDLPAEVELKEYSNFKIKKPEVKIEQKEIDQQIKILSDQFAVYQPKEKGSLAVGDIAVFDFKGTINGEEFPGNKAENVKLEIGSKQFIAGFEEQMVGMNLLETKTFKVTFPENYQVENLTNKEAEFTVLLKEIKIKLVSDNNEELVKDVNLPNVNSYQELIDYLKVQLKEQKTKTIKDEFLDDVFSEILKTAKVIVPNSLIEEKTNFLLNDFKAKLQQQGYTFDDYQKMSNLSEQDVRKAAQEDALRELQIFGILKEVGEKEKITASDVEIETYLKQISIQFNIPVEEIKKNDKYFPLIKAEIIRSKALEWLWINNGEKEILNKIEEESNDSILEKTKS